MSTKCKWLARAIQQLSTGIGSFSPVNDMVLFNRFQSIHIRTATVIHLLRQGPTQPLQIGFALHRQCVPQICERICEFPFDQQSKPSNIDCLD